MYGDDEYRERRKRLLESLCPDTVSGKHAPLDRDGKCGWCGKRISTPMPKPTTFDGPTQLDHYYEQFYDPDWGGHNGH